MMIKCLGTLNIVNGISTIYFIFSENILYIGETTGYSVKRLSAHLTEGGSFLKNYIRAQLEDFDKSDLKVISMDIGVGNDKKLVQAVEHSLHLKLSADPFINEEAYKIISTTKRTAPRSYDYSNADKIASEVLRLLKLKLAK